MVAVAQLVRALDCGSRGFAGSIPVSHPIPRRGKASLELNSREAFPFKLLYQESHPTQSAALKREAQIKNWSRAKKLALIKGCYKELINLV